MKLTHATYYSREADHAYMSNSQFKGWLQCPRRQWAKMNGLWTDDEPMAFLVGKYVDQWLLTPGEVDAFVEANRESIFTRQGKPRAEIMTADKMIERAERDDLFMGSLDGHTQRLITWNMFGVKWRALLDVVDPERKTLVDLKTVRDFEPVWSAEHKTKLPFYEIYGYWQQLAIYRAAYFAEFGFMPDVTAIAAVSKQASPRLKVIEFNNAERFAHELSKVEAKLPEVLQYKAAIRAEDVPACGACDYCAEHQEAVMEAAESLVW